MTCNLNLSLYYILRDYDNYIYNPRREKLAPVDFK
jgi:hypothetical protein